MQNLLDEADGSAEPTEQPKQYYSGDQGAEDEDDRAQSDSQPQADDSEKGENTTEDSGETAGEEKEWARRGGTIEMWERWPVML